MEVLEPILAAVNVLLAGIGVKEVFIIEQSLYEWRTLLLRVDRWLRWNHQSKPAILVARVTIFFTFLWWFEPTVLTTVSLLTMLACLMDYIQKAEEWTEDDQRQYHQLCIGLIKAKDSLVQSFCWLTTTKEERPKQYIFQVVVVLSFIAYIGNLISNFCFFYFLAVFLVLLPGLHQRRLLRQAYANRELRDDDGNHMTYNDFRHLRR